MPLTTRQIRWVIRSPVNLAGAQFEAFIEAAGKDTDAPQATNMIVIYTTPQQCMTGFIQSMAGSDSFTLPTGLDWQAFVANPDNFMTKPGQQQLRSI